jgi:hypothetical protein
LPEGGDFGIKGCLSGASRCFLGRRRGIFPLG